MAASELQKQLARHREATTFSTTSVNLGKRRGVTPSIIYDPKDAFSLDIDELRKRAQESFDVLSSTIDPDLANVNLFRPSRTTIPLLSKKRGFLTPTESKEVDELINRFIYRIGAYWQDEKVLHCLEYLIRQFSIQKYNIDALIAISLPFLDTTLFAKLVRILELPTNSQFLFLDGVQKSSTPLKRSIVVQNCIRNPFLLSFLGAAVIKTSTELNRLNLPLTSFFVLLSLELLSSSSFVPSEKSLRQLIPCLFFALQNPSLRELHIGALCILSQMSQRMILSNSTCNAIMIDLFDGILRGTNSLTRRQIALTEGFMFLSLLVISQSSTHPNALSPLLIPSKILTQFCKQNNRDDIINSIYEVARGYKDVVDISGLVGCIYRSLFHEMGDAINQKTLDLFSNFATMLIEKSVIQEQRAFRGSLRCRISICLAAFDVICDAKDIQKVSAIVSPSLHLLEDLYPNTVAMALRHVVETPNANSKMTARIIDVLTSSLNSSPTGLLSTELSTEFSDGSSFSIWNAMGDSNFNIRIEAVNVALSRLDKFFNSTPNDQQLNLPAGIRLLIQILIDRSTDKHLPIAQLILSHEKLWMSVSIPIALSSLFQQFYLIIERLTLTDPLLFPITIPDNISPSSLSVTDILIIILISAPSQLFQRFLSILKTLTVVFSKLPSKIVMEAFYQLAPILLPLAWALSRAHFDNNSLVNELNNCVMLLLETFDHFNICDLPLVNTVEKKKKKLINVEKSISKESVKSLFLTMMDLPLKIPISWKMGPITVISIDHDGCPTIETNKDFLLGGIWPLMGRLESSNGEESPETLQQLLLLTGNLWEYALNIGELTSTGSKYDGRLFTELIVFSLCDVIEPEEILTLISKTKIAQLFGFIVSNTKVNWIPTGLLSRASSSSARILGEISNNDKNYLYELVGPILIGLINDDLSVRTESLNLLKIIRKSPSINLIQSFENIEEWNLLIRFPEDVTIRSRVKKLMTHVNLRAFLKSIVKHSSDIVLGSDVARSSLQSLIESLDNRDEILLFIGSLSCLFSAAGNHYGSKSLLSLLSGASLPCAFLDDICIPIWKSCLSNDYSLEQLGDSLTGFLQEYKNVQNGDEKNEILRSCVKSIWTSIIKPYCKLHEEEGPDKKSYKLFLELIKSFIQSNLFDLLDNRSQLLKVLVRSAVHWSQVLTTDEVENESSVRSLCSLLREIGAIRFSPEDFIQRFKKYEKSGFQELILIVECLTISLDKNQSEWNSELRCNLMKMLIGKQFVQDENEQLNPILLVIAILRCIQQCIEFGFDEDNQGTILGVIQLCVERCRLIIEKRKGRKSIEKKEKKLEENENISLEELIVPLLDLVVKFANECDSKLRNGRNEILSHQIDDLLNQIVYHIIKPQLEKTPVLLQSSKLVSSFQLLIPKLLTSCLPIDHDERSAKLQKRSLLWIEGLTPIIVRAHVQHCFSSTVEGRPLDEERSKQESEQVQQKIITIARAMNEEEIAVASLLFNVVYNWGEQIHEMGLSVSNPKLKKGKTDNNDEIIDFYDKKIITTDRWIVDTIIGILNKLNLGNQIIYHLCIIGYSYLLKRNKNSGINIPSFSQPNQLHLFMEISFCSDTGDSNIDSKPKAFMPKCIFIIFLIMRQYLQLVGCPSLDDPNAVLSANSINENDAHDQLISVKYQSSSEAKWITHLLEILLLISSWFNQMASTLTPQILPIRSLIKKTTTEIVQNVSFLLGTCQLVNEAFLSKVDLSIISELLLLISSFRFPKRLESIFANVKQTTKIDRQKRLRQEPTDRSNDELISPLSSKEIEAAVKIEKLIASTVSLVVSVCPSLNQSRRKKKTSSPIHPPISSLCITAASFLSDLIIVAGAALPSVFESLWISPLTNQLKDLSERLTFEKLEETNNEAWCWALCRNIFAMSIAMPSHSYIEHLNILVENLIKITDFSIQSNFDPIIRITLLSFMTLLSFPSRHFMSQHFPSIIDSVLVNPSIVFKLVLPHSPKLFLSSFEIFKSFAKPEKQIIATADQLPNHIGSFWLINSAASPSSHHDDSLSNFHHLWSRLFYLVATTVPLRVILASLQASSKLLANRIASCENNKESSSSAAFCFGCSLTLLSTALNSTTPEAVVLHHKEISALLLTAVHAACTHVERLTDGANDVAHILSIDVQSGVMEELFYTPRIRKSFRNNFSVLDLLTLTDELKNHRREFGFLESSICLAFRSWLPIMTNSHLQPFIKTLLKYCRRGNKVLMYQQEEDNQKESRPLLATDRDAAASRLIVMLLSTISIELGQIGIVGCLADVAPDLNQIIIATAQNAFHQSLIEKQKQTTTLSSKKKSKRASLSSPPRLLSTWWWSDLGIPTLYCLSLCASAITSASSSNSVLVEATLTSVIDTLDVCAIIDRPCILLKDKEDENDDDDDDDNEVSMGDAILLACQHCINHLIGSVIRDQLQLQKSIRLLLDKIQNTKHSVVRLAGVLVLSFLWTHQSVALLPTLSDSLQVFGELLEDHHHEVEQASRQLIQIIEGITGESLEPRLRL